MSGGIHHFHSLFGAVPMSPETRGALIAVGRTVRTCGQAGGGSPLSPAPVCPPFPASTPPFAIPILAMAARDQRETLMVRPRCPGRRLTATTAPAAKAGKIANRTGEPA